MSDLDRCEGLSELSESKAGRGVTLSKEVLEMFPHISPVLSPRQCQISFSSTASLFDLVSFEDDKIITVLMGE